MQLKYEVYYTTYQVLFHVWKIKPVMKHSKLSKIYDHDCIKNLALYAFSNNSDF